MVDPLQAAVAAQFSDVRVSFDRLSRLATLLWVALSIDDAAFQRLEAAAHAELAARIGSAATKA